MSQKNERTPFSTFCYTLGMMLENILDLPLITYSHARSLGFATEFFLLNSLSRLVPGSKQALSSEEYRTYSGPIRTELHRLFRNDVANIRQGLYPISVLKPESPGEHLRR